MDPSQRVVTRVPLTELWNNDGGVDAAPAGSVGETEIALLLRAGSTFVVADPGLPLRWVPVRERFDFWKTEVKLHLVARAATTFRLEDFPSSYCYVATEWRTKEGPPVVLLEKHH